jgi:hypothetical protein
MWHTPKGQRVLNGAEAALIRASLECVVDLVEAESEGDEPWQFDIRLFDQLGWSHKLALLAKVGGALLIDTVAPVELNGINEAAVAVLYRNINEQVVIEVDSHDDSAQFDGTPCVYWRTLVRDAWMAVEGNAMQTTEEFQFPVCEGRDLEDWEILVEVLQDQVLWDEDWEMDDLFMDVDPELSSLRKNKLGISADYYTAIVPEPDEEMLASIRTQLSLLINE